MHGSRPTSTCPIECRPHGGLLVGAAYSTRTPQTSMMCWGRLAVAVETPSSCRAIVVPYLATSNVPLQDRRDASDADKVTLTVGSGPVALGGGRVCSREARRECCQPTGNRQEDAHPVRHASRPFPSLKVAFEARTITPSETKVPSLPARPRFRSSAAPHVPKAEEGARKSIARFN